MKNELKIKHDEHLESFVFRMAEESLLSIPSEAHHHTKMRSNISRVSGTRQSMPQVKSNRENLLTRAQKISNETTMTTSRLFNENESITEIGITATPSSLAAACGQRADNRIILSNFHDALSTELRGKSNYLHMSDSRSSSSSAKPSNDPEVFVSTYGSFFN